MGQFFKERKIQADFKQILKLQDDVDTANEEPTEADILADLNEEFKSLISLETAEKRAFNLRILLDDIHEKLYDTNLAHRSAAFIFLEQHPALCEKYVQTHDALPEENPGMGSGPG